MPETLKVSDNPPECKEAEYPSAMGAEAQIGEPFIKKEEPVSSLGSGPTRISSAWKVLPVPDGPDKHDEFYRKIVESPDGLPIIGARARGKKHKHEGTNCDDWFEIKKSGAWTIIAVADGAGSHLFSRVGAKIACKAAIAHLAEKLSSVTLTERTALAEWQECLSRNAEWVFSGADVEMVQLALIEAMQKSFEAIELAAQERKVETRELSTTLLLSVHSSIKCADKSYDFILSTQIGDGMIAALFQGNCSASLLAEPDTGAFAGQTDFITSRSKLTPSAIRTRTKLFFSPMLILMVMTDGVSDDYFPHGPGMQRLFCDLVLNGIVRPLDEKNSDSTAGDEIEQPAASATAEDYIYQVEREKDGVISNVEVRDAQLLSELLGYTVEDLAKSPMELMKYSLQRSQAAVPSACLEDWLDGYQVRGSFDDRTIVLLYRPQRGVGE